MRARAATTPRANPKMMAGMASFSVPPPNWPMPNSPCTSRNLALERMTPQSNIFALLGWNARTLERWDAGERPHAGQFPAPGNDDLGLRASSHPSVQAMTLVFRGAGPRDQAGNGEPPFH